MTTTTPKLLAKPLLAGPSEMINTSYLFALWYLFSIFYNIFSKNSLNMAPALSWTTATLQMFLGLTYVLPLWQSGIRDRPKLSSSEIVRLLPVAILHSALSADGAGGGGGRALRAVLLVLAQRPLAAEGKAAVDTVQAAAPGDSGLRLHLGLKQRFVQKFLKFPRLTCTIFET